jgi:hypothetical protein
VNHQLNLIQIHKRNIEILGRQKAELGLHCPMHVQSQLEHELKAIKEAEKTLQRRLQGLLQQSATYGISADPAIGIEIEDIEEYFNPEKM